MIIRNGVMSVIRAKGRTVLFTLLIFILVVTTILGLGMWAYCSQLLEKCDASYKSVAYIEYLGTKYNDIDAADDYARAAARVVDDLEIEDIAGVKLWEPEKSSFAHVDGYKRAIGKMPLGNNAVLELTHFIDLTTEIPSGDPDVPPTRVVSYSAYVERAWYSSDDAEDKLVIIYPEETGFAPEKYDTYLVNLQEEDNTPSGNRTYTVRDFYEGCPQRPFLNLSDEENPDTEIFSDYVNKYQTINNYVRIESAMDVETLEVFHQKLLHLESGRFPAYGEADACVVSGIMAQAMDLSVGDTLTVREMVSDADDRFVCRQTDIEKSLRITGITNANLEYEGHIWTSADISDFSSPLFGFLLGRVILENDQAEKTVESIREMLPDLVRVTLYDQGYASAARPIRTMLSAAQAITITSICGVLIVLFLFAYLFINRQKVNVEILVSLGTPSAKIWLWMLSGVTLILVVAIALGALIGWIVLDDVILQTLDAARNLYVADQRYSEALIGVTAAPDMHVTMPLWPVYAAVTGIFVTAVLLCLLFLSTLQRGSVRKKGRIRVHVPKSRTSVAGTGALRFAWLSAKRGGWRSWVVYGAALGMAVFTGVLLGTGEDKQSQLEMMYASPIEGNVVSLNGRNYTGMSMTTESVRRIVNSGLVEDVFVSTSWHCWKGQLPDFGTGLSADERMMAWINAQPSLVAVNDLSAAPEFYYTAKPVVEWLDGWDETMFVDASYEPFVSPVYPVIASQSLLDMYGWQPGETQVLSMFYQIGAIKQVFPITVQVVGVFAKSGELENLYTPLTFACPLELFTNTDKTITDIEAFTHEDIWMLVKSYTFDTCRFTIPSANQLGAFRDYLDENQFSSVGHTNRVRTAVMLRDQNFTETVGSIQRYMLFTGILFPVLLVVIGMMGFVISWLMINGRRMEFAMMRSLGAGKRRAFFSFFLEQTCLCLLGCLSGVAILLVLGMGWVVWLSAAGFFLCYLSGSALSVLMIGRTKLMGLLSDS